MFSFLKRFGWGVLYILLLPIALIILVLTTIYCCLSFFYELFLGIISFFKGKQFFPPLPEDVEAKTLLESGYISNNQKINSSTDTNQNSINSEEKDDLNDFESSSQNIENEEL